jgi:hypothetical protein
MICEHDDCYTCPYSDCIVTDEKEMHRQKKKPVMQTAETTGATATQEKNTQPWA